MVSCWGKKETFVQSLRLLLVIAIPLIIERLVYELQSMTDKAFLGNLETEYVSAVGAAQAPYGVTVNFLYGISTGQVIIVSQLWGKREKEKMNRVFLSTAFYITLLSIGIFFLWICFARPILAFFQVDTVILEDSAIYIQICAGYMIFFGIDVAIQSMLLGMGKTKPIMYCAMIKVIVNIITSWFLIFGHMGFPVLYVRGAAIGSLFANVCATIFLFLYAVKFCNESFMRCINFQDVIKFNPFLEVIKLGIPAGLEFLLWNFSNLMLIRLVNEFSYIATGMYTLTYSLQCFACVFYQGTCNAAMTLIGQSVGQANYKKTNTFFKYTMTLNLMIVLLFAVIFCLIPGKLLDIFSNDRVLIHMGAEYLPLVAMTMFPQSINLVCGSAIRAHNDTKWMLFSQVIGSTLIILMSWLFVKIFRLDMAAIYLTVCIDETIRGVVNYIYYQKHYGKHNGKNSGKYREKYSGKYRGKQDFISIDNSQANTYYFI